MSNKWNCPEAAESGPKIPKKDPEEMNRQELLAELTNYGFDENRPKMENDLARDIHALLIKDTDQSRSEFPDFYSIFDLNDAVLRAAITVLRMNDGLTPFKEEGEEEKKENN